MKTGVTTKKAIMQVCRAIAASGGFPAQGQKNVRKPAAALWPQRALSPARRASLTGVARQLCKTATTGYARGSKKAMPMSGKDKPPTVK